MTSGKRGEAVIGGGREEVAREVGVLVEDEDDLVRVKPSVPQVGVYRTEWGPEIHESRFLLFST